MDVTPVTDGVRMVWRLTSRRPCPPKKSPLGWDAEGEGSPVTGEETQGGCLGVVMGDSGHQCSGRYHGERVGEGDVTGELVRFAWEVWLAQGWWDVTHPKGGGSAGQVISAFLRPLSVDVFGSILTNFHVAHFDASRFCTHPNFQSPLSLTHFHIL